ncbi:hypothetical protein IB231_08155 [Pantoea sp. PNT02]|uniref:hypothetical protein n=1 Tax=Pantoea sp. PNT02 TaxID=2769261 RepID=UPI001781878C|nr:hypothetical protein [Pantoea sp. PNT02]MBD9643594.1 hypothetical protein [Pantoea sp. PNT02]
MDRLKSAYRFGLVNPHLSLSFLLFSAGAAIAFTSLPTLAGALIGGGASLLGAWISDLNSKKQKIEEKKLQESAAKNYARPELYRSIENLIRIHSRALVNTGIWADVEINKRPGLITDVGDKQVDFFPILPVLYPNFENLKHIPSSELYALVRYYDSLYELEKFVKNWWEREGQQNYNIYNVILQNAHRSLELALECINIFELDKFIPPRYSGWKPLKFRIEQENNSHTATMERISKMRYSQRGL